MSDTQKKTDDDSQASKFEWKPEDVEFMNPDDPHFHDDDDEYMDIK